MKGYLQRLVTRAEPAAGGARSLRPWVASRSPVAELDQRVSLPGFEAAGLVPEQPSEHDRGAAITAAPRGPTPAPPSRHDSPLAGTGRAGALGLEGKTSPLPRKGSGVLISRGDSGEGPVVGGGTAAPSEATPRFSLRVPSTQSGERAAGNVPGGETPMSASGTTVRPHAAPPFEPDVPASFPIFIEDSVRRPSGPPAGASGLANGDGRVTPPEPPRGGGTRLEIGTIEVEVVPPPRAEPRPAPPARPMTAESVSQIGPLSARRRSNLRYALRQR